jgi:hypothetical protein
MSMTPEQAEQLRAHMRRATTAVFEILLDQYGIDDRIAVLRGAWGRSVLPALTNEAERRALELETFPVQFPSTVQRRRRKR